MQRQDVDLTMVKTLPQLLASELNGRSGLPILFETRQTRTTRTLREIIEDARHFAGGLRDRGVGPGDRVALQLPNGPEQLTVQLATIILGAVLVPVVPIFGAAEISSMLADSRPQVLVSHRTWRRIDYLENWARVDEDLRPPIFVLVGGVRPDDPSQAVDFEDLLSASPVMDFHQPDPEDVCLILSTSGSSGIPKGVQHTHRSLLHEARETPYWADGVSDRPQVLQATAAGHIGGASYVLRMMLNRNKYHVIDWWDLDLAVRAIDEHRIRAFSGTPFHLTSMMERATQLGLDISCLKQVILGGAPVDPRAIRDADAAGIVAVRAYGSTEHPTITIGDYAASLDERANWDGRPNPWSKVRIIDDDGNDVPIGEPGEVVSVGGEQFIGYTNAPLEESMTADGWFMTGDIGVVDETGLLKIVDRKKNIIIRGGENLSIAEIEMTAIRHPDVADVAIVGVPDLRYGERACAFVVPHDGATIDLDSFRAFFLAEGIAKQKIPEFIEVVDSLPYGGLQKVRRGELKQRWLELHPHGAADPAAPAETAVSPPAG